MMKYDLWRNGALVGVFDFYELRDWMLDNLPSDWAQEILRSVKATGSSDDAHYTLAWIGVCSEYCHVTEHV